MCIAVHIPANAERPTLDQHRAMSTSNRDGAGIAWVNERGLVQWEKGFPSKDYEKVFSRIASLPKSTPILLHYRIATIGGVKAELTHPFPITARAGVMLKGSAGSVMIHNGHWSDAPLKMLGDSAGPISDTRILAAVASYDGNVLATLAKSYGKSARLNGDGTVTRFGTGWIESDGVWYSNYGFKTYSYPSNSTGYSGHYPGACAWGDGIDNDGETAYQAYQRRERERYGRSVSVTHPITVAVDGSAAKVEGPRRRGSGRSLVDQAQDLLDNPEPIFTPEEREEMNRATNLGPRHKSALRIEVEDKIRSLSEDELDALLDLLSGISGTGMPAADDGEDEGGEYGEDYDPRDMSTWSFEDFEEYLVNKYQMDTRILD